MSALVRGRRNGKSQITVVPLEAVIDICVRRWFLAGVIRRTGSLPAGSGAVRFAATGLTWRLAGLLWARAGAWTHGTAL